MSIEKLRRPGPDATNYEKLAYYRETATALDRLGVPRGGEFILAKPEADGGPDEHDANALGGFSRNSGTSRQAAVDNYPRSGSQRHRVLVTIVRSGYGHTRDELAEGLSLPDSSTDGRVWELLKGGWVRETEATRVTRAGSQAKVLVGTLKGQEAVREHEGAVA